MSPGFSLSSFISASSSSHNFFHHGSLSLRISSLWHCCALVITGADLDVKASRLSGETSWILGAAKKELNSNIYFQFVTRVYILILKNERNHTLNCGRRWESEQDLCSELNNLQTIEIESENIPAWPGIEHWSLWCSSSQNVSLYTEPRSPQEKIRGGWGHKHRLTKCKPQIKLNAKHIQIDDFAHQAADLHPHSVCPLGIL